MQLKIYHSVNSGLYIINTHSHLLIDSVHNGVAAGFSPMPSMRFPAENLLFTHDHADHFDSEKVAQVASASSAIYCPASPLSTIQETPLTENLGLLKMDNFLILSLHSGHDCRQFASIPHRSYLIQSEGEALFIAGDAVFQAADAETLLALEPDEISAAFVNLYQIAHKGSQDFLRKLNPKRIFLYHLPFPEDDIFQIHTSMRSALKKYPSDLPVPEILTHMSWIDGNCPD